MAILETEAVVLSSIPQGESSKIVRLITKSYGRVSIIAKGSRKSKNRFGAALDSLNHVSAVYYYKESRELQILTQCDIIDSFSEAKEDLNKLALGLAAAEVIQKLFIEEEENVPVFMLLTGALKQLGEFEKNYINIYWSFLARFLALSGFELNLLNCSGCGIEVEDKSASFSLSRGGLICGECKNNEITYKMSAVALQTLKRIIQKEPETLVTLQSSEKTFIEINSFFENYFRYHFEHYSAPQAMKLYL